MAGKADGARSRPGILNITSGLGTAQISQKQVLVKKKYQYEITAILLSLFLSHQVVTVTKGDHIDDAMRCFSVLQI